MENNYIQIQEGFRTLLKVMSPYMAREFYNEFGEDERSRAFDAQIPHRLAELSTTRGLIDGFAPMPKL